MISLWIIGGIAAILFFIVLLLLSRRREWRDESKVTAYRVTSRRESCRDDDGDGSDGDEEDDDDDDDDDDEDDEYVEDKYQPISSVAVGIVMFIFIMVFVSTVLTSVNEILYLTNSTSPTIAATQTLEYFTGILPLVTVVLVIGIILMLIFKFGVPSSNATEDNQKHKNKHINHYTKIRDELTHRRNKRK